MDDKPPCFFAIVRFHLVARSQARALQPIGFPPRQQRRALLFVTTSSRRSASNHSILPVMFRGTGGIPLVEHASTNNRAAHAIQSFLNAAFIYFFQQNSPLAPDVPLLRHCSLPSLCWLALAFPMARKEWFPPLTGKRLRSSRCNVLHRNLQMVWRQKRKKDI
jgi:hypothetical protein